MARIVSRNPRLVINGVDCSNLTVDVTVTQALHNVAETVVRLIGPVTIDADGTIVVGEAPAPARTDGRGRAITLRGRS